MGNGACVGRAEPLRVVEVQQSGYVASHMIYLTSVYAKQLKHFPCHSTVRYVVPEELRLWTTFIIIGTRMRASTPKPRNNMQQIFYLKIVLPFWTSCALPSLSTRPVQPL